MDVVGLTRQDVDRLRRMIRWFESRPPDGGEVAGGRVPNWQHVRVTGAAIGNTGSGSGSGSGDGLRYWPGEVVLWDATDELIKSLADVWIKEFNDFELEVGAYYTARQSGDHKIDEDRRHVFVIGDGLIARPFGDCQAGSGGSGGCPCGVAISDLIKCNPETKQTEIADACIDIAFGRIVLRDQEGNIIAGG